MQLLLSNGANTNDQSLSFAVDAGDIEVVQSLLKAGADITAKDTKGNTMIQLARLKGHEELFELLEDYSLKSN